MTLTTDPFCPPPPTVIVSRNLVISGVSLPKSSTIWHHLGTPLELPSGTINGAAVANCCFPSIYTDKFSHSYNYNNQTTKQQITMFTSQVLRSTAALHAAKQMGSQQVRVTINAGAITQYARLYAKKVPVVAMWAGALGSALFWPFGAEKAIKTFGLGGYA